MNKTGNQGRVETRGATGSLSARAQPLALANKSPVAPKGPSKRGITEFVCQKPLGASVLRPRQHARACGPLRNRLIRQHARLQPGGHGASHGEPIADFLSAVARDFFQFLSVFVLLDHFRALAFDQTLQEPAVKFSVNLARLRWPDPV